jgi:hypothetical protein
MQIDEKGYISLLLVVLIAFGFLLSGGLLPLGQQAPSSTAVYTLVNPPKPSPHQTLQLASLTFVLNTTCNPGQLTSGEPDILFAAQPGPKDSASGTDSIKLWYTDEWALTLGEETTADPVSHMQKFPADTIVNPQVGDQTRDRYGFPVFPALFLTDITDDPTNTSGDALNAGSRPISPSTVYGAWKTADGADPEPPNGTNLDTGGGIFPAQRINGNGNGGPQGYTAEVEWKISDLLLHDLVQPGHIYRAQFVVHDGDRGREGGDIGLGCTTIQLSSN